MSNLIRCRHCLSESPDIGSVSERDWHIVLRALCEHDSEWCAIGAIRMVCGVDESSARAWLAHLLSCCRSWPFSEEDMRRLARVDQEFSGFVRPEHFTNPECCAECREHDETLISRNVQNLRQSDLGSDGWTPLFFISDPGLMYYLPAILRWAMVPSLRRSQFPAEVLLLRLSDAAVADLSPDQKAAVSAVLPGICAVHGLDESTMARARSVWG